MYFLFRVKFVVKTNIHAPIRFGYFQYLTQFQKIVFLIFQFDLWFAHKFAKRHEILLFRI